MSLIVKHFKSLERWNANPQIEFSNQSLNTSNDAIIETLDLSSCQLLKLSQRINQLTRSFYVSIATKKHYEKYDLIFE